MIDNFLQQLPDGFDSVNRIITNELLKPLE